MTAPDSNPKSSFGTKKPSLALIPQAALVEEAVAFELGAEKYGAYNWRDTSVSMMVYLNAALRHIAAFVDGEDVDPESGISHAAHARACLGIIIDGVTRDYIIDDRPEPGAAGARIKALTRS